MGTLVPADFRPGSLDETERLMVTELVDGLTENWHILPDVSFEHDGHHQVDIVIAHPRDGIGIIEVKGYCPRIESGIWYHGGGPLELPPTKQLARNRFGLRNLLRTITPELAHLNVAGALAFPHAADIAGQIPPDLYPHQVIVSGHLPDLQDVVDLLMATETGIAISSEVFEAIINRLRPDAEFRFDAGTRARSAHRRLDEIAAAQTRALEGLDVNRRVFVTGGAGTGKTRLAAAWAARAARREERVLLVCFNEPLADQLRAAVPERDNLRVGAFFPTALHLDGMPPLEIPDGADAEFWDQRALGHLHSHWPEITEWFDTIVIDEAQDFSPAWLALLTSLLDPDGERRVLMVGDAHQELHARGFVEPSSDDGWVRCELVNNTRNTFGIARILRRRLGGPPAPVGGPESHVVAYHPAAEVHTAVQLVRQTLDDLDAAGVAPDSIIVATLTSAVRDALRTELGLVPWEERGTAVVAETVRRVKGLEADHVVLVGPDVSPDADPDHPVPDMLLYVGVSRAVLGLTVIAHPLIGERLGLR